MEESGHGCNIIGKLADAIIAYKQATVDSPAEREAKDIITAITESDWWKTTVGTEFKWPKKGKYKWKPFGFTPDEYITVGHFIIPKWNQDKMLGLLGIDPEDI